MSETLELDLKAISKEGVPKAIEKAEHYRLLNDPEQAESICLDILDVEPGHQRALRVLVLALTDQFATSPHETAIERQAREYAARLTDEYERIYYSGLICERQARAQLAHHAPGYAAWDWFQQALECYHKAEAIRPPGNEDPILRWNSCVRTMRADGLHPRAREEDEQALE
jgi:hypothetical protein